MATAKRLTERVNTPFAGTRVNREAGTIDGVLICGTASANGRDYPAAVLRRDHAVYEGAVVNCDHARESTVDRRFGWFTNVKPGDDGRPRGTLNVLLQHPMAARVFEAAERNPALFGFSHVAMCDTRRDAKTGREVVEAIKSVESIDLVASPATTKGLFEGKAVGLTVKALVEALVKHPKTTAKQVAPLKLLAEMDGMGDMATPMDAPPADDADPADGVKEAFKTAVLHIVDQAMSGDMDPKDALSKIKTLLKSHGEVNGGKTADTDGDGDTAGDTDGDGDAKESKQPTLAAVVAECKAAGLESPPVEFVADLMAVPGKDTRASLVKRFREAKANAAAEKPRSGSRPPGAAEAGVKPVAESSVPTTAKEFAASIRD